MILKAFTIYDSKAKVFHLPFFKHTHGEAERDFTELVRDEKSLIAKYPDDYDLYVAGEYNDQTGVFQSLDTPQHLIKAAALKT